MDQAIDRVAKVLVLVILALLCIRLAGCASAPTPREEAVARVTVLYTTLKVIDGKPDRAARLLAVLDQIEAAGEPMTVDEFADHVKAAIPWSEIEPAEQALVLELINQARIELTTRIPSGPAPIGDVAEVLGWVREAALIAAPAS